MKTRQLPQRFHQYFWDVDPQAIDLVERKTYVIKRLLERGNTEAIYWLQEQYSTDDIVEVLRRSRELSRKTGLFWAHLLEIPSEEVRCKRLIERYASGFKDPGSVKSSRR